MKISIFILWTSVCKILKKPKHNLCSRVLRNFVKLDLRANVDVTFTIATPSYMFMLPVLQGQIFTSLSLIKIIPKLVFILHDSVIFVVLFFILNLKFNLNGKIIWLSNMKFVTRWTDLHPEFFLYLFNVLVYYNVESTKPSGF